MPLLNRLMLAPPDAESAVEKPLAADGDSRLTVGDLGVAFTPLDPGAKAVSASVIDVLASGDFLDRGTPIRVARVTGNQVLVEAIEEQT